MSFFFTSSWSSFKGQKKKKKHLLSLLTHALLYRRSRKRVQKVERYTNAKANQCSGDPCGRLVSVNREKEVKPGRAAAAAAAALVAFFESAGE